MINNIICILIIFTFASCTKKDDQSQKMFIRAPDGQQQSDGELKRYKIMFVDSYSGNYEWSRDLEAGIRDYFKKESFLVNLKVFHMNTKRYKTETYKKNIAHTAKGEIDDWNPDLVIACDDNAAKYLIAPYLRGAKVPVVFCGINWDASPYGLPSENVTGVLEVANADETVKFLKKISKGDRIGYIGGDTVTENRELKNYKDVLGINFADGALVNNFAEWKREYLRLQKTVDMLVWLSPYGIERWDNEEALKFIYENTEIPTGTNADYSAKFAMLSVAKTGWEQGGLAAKTAIEILRDKRKPHDIPVKRNEKFNAMFNERMARELGFKLPYP